MNDYFKDIFIDIIGAYFISPYDIDCNKWYYYNGDQSICYFFSFFKEKKYNYKNLRFHYLDVLLYTDLFQEPTPDKYEGSFHNLLKETLLKKTGRKKLIFIREKILNGTLIRNPDHFSGDCLFTNYTFNRKHESFHRDFEEYSRVLQRQSDILLDKNDFRCKYPILLYLTKEAIIGVMSFCII
jgi:hypothetical protein